MESGDAAVGSGGEHPAFAYRVLPFELRRQALAGPGGEGIGFVVTDMQDRFLRAHRPRAVQRVLEPPGPIPHPVQRGIPALRVYSSPAVGQPQLVALVSTIGAHRNTFVVAEA